MPNTPEYLTTLALSVKLFAILKSLRKRESSKFKKFWTPASAGVTVFRLFTRSSNLILAFLSVFE
jgi:hypothetical protein